MKFMDVYYIAQQYTPFSFGKFVFADLTNVGVDVDEYIITLRLERSPAIAKKLAFQKGKIFAMEKRVVDITLRLSLKALKEIDEHGDKSMFQVRMLIWREP